MYRITFKLSSYSCTVPSIAWRLIEERSTSSNYRPDVQGLRGIAVILVVLYHIGFPLEGGFVGVDVFFVISGFVISRLIIAERASSDGFSFMNFFARRISRLVPLYAIVCLATILLAHFALSPFGEVQDVVRTGLWSAGFSANHQLLIENSYVGLEHNPLRHLWSLAVEEQFYLFFPVVFVGVLSLRSRGIRCEDRGNLLLIGIWASSFVLCVYFSHFGSTFLQSASFFIAPTRAWQFLSGAGVALNLEKKVDRYAGSLIVLRVASSAGLVWASLTFSEEAPYPGLWAVLPTLATVGLLCSSRPGTMLFRFLTLRPMRLAGELSYGVYLWHWPIVVFVSRHVTITPVVAASIVVASFALTALGFIVVENPVRTNFRSPQRAIVVLGVSLGAILGTSNWVGRSAEETFARALSPEVTSDAQMVRFGLGVRDTRLNLVGTCDDPSSTISDLQRDCSNHFEGDGVQVLLLGDSHAAALGDGLFLAGSQSDFGVTGFFEYGCPLIDGYTVQRIEDCVSSIRRSLEIVSEIRPEFVVLAQSYSAYVTYEQEATTVISADRDSPISAATKSRTQRLVADAGLRLRQLVDLGTKVLLVREVPFAIMPGTSTAIEFDAHSRLLELINEELNNQVASLPGVTLVDLAESICPIEPPCALDSEGRLLYWHKTHLNRRGSERLIPVWTELFGAKREQDK